MPPSAKAEFEDVTFWDGTTFTTSSAALEKHEETRVQLPPGRLRPTAPVQYNPRDPDVAIPDDKNVADIEGMLKQRAELNFKVDTDRMAQSQRDATHVTAEKIGDKLNAQGVEFDDDSGTFWFSAADSDNDSVVTLAGKRKARSAEGAKSKRPAMPKKSEYILEKKSCFTLMERPADHLLLMNKLINRVLVRLPARSPVFGATRPASRLLLLGG